VQNNQIDKTASGHAVEEKFVRNRIELFECDISVTALIEKRLALARGIQPHSFFSKRFQCSNNTCTVSHRKESVTSQWRTKGAGRGIRVNRGDYRQPNRQIVCYTRRHGVPAPRILFGRKEWPRQ
jgi:hypothetical protein